MKKIMYSILVAVGLFAASCYDDKGNYDYTTIGEIVVTGMEESYSVVTAFDTLHISPQFEGKENYDCLWTMYPNLSADAVPDTLSTMPDLEYPVTHEPNTYTLVLTVISKLNGDRQYFTSEVEIRSEYSVGCYILKEVEGQTDIDLYSPEFELAPDILHSTSSRVAGRPLSFALCSEQTILDENGIMNTGVKTIWICADEDVRNLRLDNMEPLYDIHSMFIEEPEGEQPQNLFSAPNYCMAYMSNNGYYNMATMVPGVHKFGLPLQVRNTSGGEPTNCAPASVVLNGQSYTMFYDELNCRFLMDWNGRLYRFLDTDVAGDPTISPNNMNADLVYMCKTGTMGLALLASRGDQARRLYRLETSEYENYEHQLFSPLLEETEVSSDLNLANATLFGHNTSIAYLYYAIGNQLYLYDYNAKREDAIALSGITGDITYIDDISTNFFTENTVEYFVVATESEGHYTIYFYRMLAGRPDLSQEPVVIEGTGRVKSVNFVS